ncbi:MAG: ankyrin repeat domain-containing protein [Brachymonas sp.]|nr:ankyrin repeat domain-containing protein [Brachymonas sp.]
MTNQRHLPPGQQPKPAMPWPEQADDLVRLYQQAQAFDELAGAQPNSAVRAAVLAAAAQNVAAIEHEAKQAMPTPTLGADVEKPQADALSASTDASDAARGDRTAAALNASSTVGVAVKLPANKRAEAANDARWKIRAMRAFGSLAAVGLVGLLASRFLPHTEGYAELAQTLPPAPYQQQAATQPAATSAQPQAEAAAAARTDSTAADASTPSPMPRTEQAVAANAVGATDAPAVAAATAPANEVADAPLPVARPAAAPAPHTAAKGKPLHKQAQSKAQQQTQQSKPTSQPHAAPSQSSAMQAPQPSTQPHRAEHAEAAAAMSAVRGVSSRSAADRAVGDSRFDQAPSRQAGRPAEEQQAASPFPLDNAPLATKGRLKSAAPQATTESVAAVQPRVQGRGPLAESVQLAPPAASDLLNERLLARRSPSAPAQAQELAPEVKQEAMPSAVPHIAAPHVSAQSKRGPLASPAAKDAAAPQAALFASASRGDVAGVQRALQVGAAINARDAAGRTALMRAAGKGHLAVVRYLLRHGADAALTDAAGRDAADYARLGGHERVTQLLSGKP